MSVLDVRQYLKSFALDQRVLEFPVSSATVELAAEAVGVEPARIAKTLSFLHKDGDRCILIVAAGDAKVDNAKFKQQFGFKAKMLDAEQVVHFTGHQIGGVCPFAIAKPENVDIYTDVSLKRFLTVFPAAGSDSSAVELTCDELYSASCVKSWVDVCKAWQE